MPDAADRSVGSRVPRRRRHDAFRREASDDGRRQDPAPSARPCGEGRDERVAQPRTEALALASRKGRIVVQQPGRRAVGQQLVYTAADDKFVLSGGSPSIFDAERGKTTGVSLTFYRRDDRVLVDGEASSPVITQTRVAR